ncbi:C40 family peptidase [Pontibacter kalidii]|uniref:C40 family peptidase n=1 Tax=Pontibacter kalidii TaxID=2592049 RepID=UPI0022594C7D|nr:NlpC/P60 family protein [Pontibacter kalidii]
MKKATILSALAILSLVLSYFYEVAPTGEPAPEQVSLVTPYAINTPEDMLRAIEWHQPLPAEEPREEYYVKSLGLRFRNPDYRELVEAASKWIGTPYRYGSSSKRGTDCSGFVTSLYQEVYGINLSRSSRSMFQDVARVQKDSVRTGDIVFFRRSAKSPISHVGIYLKNNKFIHSSTSKGVMVSSLSEPYFRKRYFAAGRVN